MLCKSSACKSLPAQPLLPALDNRPALAGEAAHGHKVLWAGGLPRDLQEKWRGVSERKSVSYERLLGSVLHSSPGTLILSTLRDAGEFSHLENSSGKSEEQN